jgi:hypothetical protein
VQLFARPEPEPKDRRRFSRTQVFEATAATILAASVLGTGSRCMTGCSVIPRVTECVRLPIVSLKQRFDHQ